MINDPFATGGVRQYGRTSMSDIAPQEAPENLRSKAFDQYMQLMGSQVPGPMPSNRLPLRNQTDIMNAFNDTTTGDSQYKDIMDQMGDDTSDPNVYFEAPNLDNVMGDNPSADINKEARDQEIRDNMRRPSYVTNKGQPSPDENYTDEDMLGMVGKSIDGGISDNLEQAQQQVTNDPSEENIKAFIEIHGEENLPDDLRDPDPNDPASNR